MKVDYKQFPEIPPNLNIESTRGKTLGEVGIPTSIALRFKT